MSQSQYGMSHYASQPSYSPSYPPTSQQSYADHRPTTSGSYPSTYASNPGLSHGGHPRRPDEHTILPPYQPQPPSLPRSPYQQHQTSDSLRSGSASHSYSYPATQGSLPSQSMGNNTSNFPPPSLYPPTSYNVGEYHPLPTMYPPSSTTPAAYPPYEPPQGNPAPPASAVSALSSSPNSPNGALMPPRVLNSRPKPQCWEHGCNGRQFSTFSNLLRHQREKSGTASKSYCPRCGAEFTRTTARNGHMAHDKCKPRRPSDASR
ncbi:hypothetical protein P153DRAFT_385262 [Dothidotthia symphoricarpi CBS 119687]|uniref:C2H2-type domain-containing protein n=1 Tax=Dothidotthia symphoricarpi CBS 119687 TaxID=1392245 RepID=A0A6A6AG62_9PLEO|nr:uncharacterized protein P153DRAFT_385262 [Dothidotthia symphoricarpi CBS 119687]KAF2130028.1 hypothetical protein P153DRAFT_385262 [Dothidotthia symphoricarpi CBS 119687]